MWRDFEKNLRSEFLIREKYPSFAPFTFDILHPTDSVSSVEVKIGIVHYNAPSSFAGVEARVEAALRKMGETKVKLVLIDLPFQKRGM